MEARNRAPAPTMPGPAPSLKPKGPNSRSVRVELAVQGAHLVVGRDAEDEGDRIAEPVAPDRSGDAVVVQALVVDPVARGDDERRVELAEDRVREVEVLVDDGAVGR